jgi:hypothetical protein
MAHIIPHQKGNNSVPTLPDTLSRSEVRCGLLYFLFGDRVGSHLQRGELETSHTLAGH